MLTGRRPCAGLEYLVHRIQEQCRLREADHGLESHLGLDAEARRHRDPQGTYHLTFFPPKRNAPLAYLPRLSKVHPLPPPLSQVAFGNVHVFGDEPGLEIAGCWLVKGQDIPQEFQDVVDFEQWDWIKVDTEDGAMRKTVEAYMCWEGDFGKDRKWASGKTYK